MGLSKVCSSVMWLPFLVYLFHDIIYANLICLSEPFESTKSISMGPTSKTSSKVGKPASNGIPKHANKAMSSVCIFHLITSVLELNVETDYILHGIQIYESLESHSNKRFKGRANDVHSG